MLLPQSWERRFGPLIVSVTKQRCAPCAWVDETMPVEQLFPIDKLDVAITAGCLFLEDARGVRYYGAARPAACRP